MSKSADEAWALANNLKAQVGMLDQRVTHLAKSMDSTAREIAREELGERISRLARRVAQLEYLVLPEEGDAENIPDALEMIKARVQHLYDVRDEDLQAEHERESGVIELRLCEANRLHLRPDTTYRFTVDPDCSLCAQAEKDARMPDPQPEGGDADVLGRKRGPTPPPDVATGAGGRSEQDPPAPSEDSEDTEGLEVVGYQAGAELRKFSGATPLVRLSDAVERIRGARRNFELLWDRYDRLKARLEAVERERDPLKDMHRTMCDVAKSRYFEIEKLEAELRQRKEGNEGSEGEVEPVGVVEKYLTHGGIRLTVPYEDIPNGSTVLYLGTDYQRLRQELEEVREKAQRFQRLYHDADERAMDRKAEIAHLRDPANWEIVAKYEWDPGDLISLSIAIRHLTVRYVGPPESEGESDGTE